MVSVLHWGQDDLPNCGEIYPLAQIKNMCGQCLSLAKGKEAGLRRHVNFFKNNGFLGKVNSHPVRDVGGHFRNFFTGHS